MGSPGVSLQAPQGVSLCCIDGASHKERYMHAYSVRFLPSFCSRDPHPHKELYTFDDHMCLLLTSVDELFLYNK